MNHIWRCTQIYEFCMSSHELRNFRLFLAIWSSSYNACMSPMGYDLSLRLSCPLHISHRVADSVVQSFPSHSAIRSKVIQSSKGVLV